jgi:hypothetical protein
MDRFLAFLGESEVFIGDMIAACFSDLSHVFKLANQLPLYAPSQESADTAGRFKQSPVRNCRRTSA